MPAARTRLHPLAAALGVACVGYFALWACAPAAMLRPPVPMPDAQNELGVGGVYNAPIATTEVEDPRATGGGLGLGPAGQVWYARHFSDRFSLGGVVFGGLAAGVGGGVQARIMAVTGEKFRLGIDAEGGFLWGAVGVPVGVRLSDRVWAYAAPGVGYRAAQLARLPVGLSIRVGDHVLLTPEVSVGYGTASPDLGAGWTGLQVYGAFGSSFRF